MTRRIVQIVREVGLGGGVNSVAFNLDREFARRGVRTGRVTSEDVPLAVAPGPQGAGRLVSTARLLWSVALFSLFAGRALRRRYGGDCVSIAHNDALAGDVYVAHSVHLAYLRTRGSLLLACLRNPLHVVVLVREAVRYRLGLHRAVVALSERNRRELERLYRVPRDKLRVIPNGVDLERFRPDAERRRRTRGALELRDETFVFLFVAHEFRKKGLAIVLAALRRLVEESRDVQLLVAGRDDPRAVAAEMRGLEAHVRFLGHRNDVDSLFSACDAFVLPTMYESFALVCLEAMATGVPVIATPVGGVEDYMVEGRTGYLVQRDAEAFRDAMARVMDDPEREAMGAAARRRAEEYSWSSVADRYLALLDELTAT